jgi:hypothetical protein
MNLKAAALSTAIIGGLFAGLTLLPGKWFLLLIVAWLTVAAWWSLYSLLSEKLKGRP